MENQEIKIEDDLFPINFESEGGIHLDENNFIVRDKGIVKDCYVCVRPGNKRNVPKVYIHNANDKEDKRVIVNNYGHGGIGWSTLWGSTKKSIELVEELVNLHSNDINNLKNKKIAVIGAGCISCGTILLLLEKGVDPQNIEIFSESVENLTSHKSGAFLSTASVLEKVDPELNKLFNYININSFLIWEKIEKGEFLPTLEGLSRVKAYFGAEKEWGTIETESGLDIFVENKLIPPPELVYLKINNRMNLMRKYDGFYFNTYKLMKGFYRMIFEEKKIKLHLGKIHNFNEIDQSFDIIFNCSALGNLTYLTQDTDVFPYAGHIITLKNQEISNLNYVIYTHYIYKEDIGKYSFTDAPLFYFMPKTDDITYSGLLGGSLIKDYTGDNQQLNEREYRGVIRRTLEIFGQSSEKFI